MAHRREPGERKRERIGQHVQPVGGERQGTAHQPDCNLEQAEAKNNEARDAQASGGKGLAPMARMTVIVAMGMMVRWALDGRVGIGAGHIIRIMH